MDGPLVRLTGPVSWSLVDEFPYLSWNGIKNSSLHIIFIWMFIVCGSVYERNKLICTVRHWYRQVHSGNCNFYNHQVSQCVANIWWCLWNKRKSSPLIKVEWIRSNPFRIHSWTLVPILLVTWTLSCDQHSRTWIWIFRIFEIWRISETRLSYW